MKERLFVLAVGLAATIVALEIGLIAVGKVHQWRYRRPAFQPDGRVVILCLGDSFTTGVGAPPGQGYPEQLEGFLNGGTGGSVRVVNAGRAAANTAMVRRLFLEMLDSVHPQVVTAMAGQANYANYTGFHRADESRAGRLVRDIWRRLHVVKLYGWLLRQWEEKTAARATPDIVLPEEVSASPVRCAKTASQREAGSADMLGKVSWDLQAQRSNSAQQQLLEALRSDPGNGRLLALLGIARVCGRWDLMLADHALTMARAAAPEDPYVLAGFSALAQLRHAPEEAASQISRAISLAPEDPFLLTFSGYLFSDRRDSATAIRLFRRALHLDPCNYQTYAALARSYLEAGRPGEAQASLAEARRLAPKDPAVLFLLSRLAANRGESAQARSWGEQLLRLAPVDIRVATTYLLAEKRYGETAALCLSRRQPAQDDLWACADAAIAMGDAGAPPRIVIGLTRQLAHDHGRDAKVLFSAGLMELLVGRTKDAEAFFSKAVALRPGDGKLIFDIAVSYLLRPRTLPELARSWAWRGMRAAPQALDFPLLILYAYGFNPRGPGLAPLDPAAIRVWTEEVAARWHRGQRLAYWSEFVGLPLESVISGSTQRFGSGVGKDEIDAWVRDDLREMARECRRRGILFVVMNYPRPSPFTGYRELAAQEGAVFADIEAAFEPMREDGSEPRFFVPDRHCNAAGYGIVARRLAQTISGSTPPRALERWPFRLSRPRLDQQPSIKHQG